MKIGSRFHHALRLRGNDRSGMALVVTLAIVVLLTFLVVAFFSATTTFRKTENTSAGAVTARILAEGAAGAVQAELIREIVEGSDVTNEVYYPTASTNMVPFRAVSTSIPATDTNFVNIVKQSGRPFYPGATIFGEASAESSATAAPNGRRVGEKRWDAPMLTGTPIAANQTPAWIYITPNGYTATISADVIGRVAFNVYDIGGLLDANVAGFAPQNGGGNPTEMSMKGSAVWADLRTIPGIDPTAFAANDAWPPKWRITGDWTSFTSDPTTSSLPYYLRSGWRAPYLNPGGTASDRMFASRQDLIRYAKAHPGTFKKSGEIITALPYFTVFSRDRERPTFRPAADRPMVAANLAAGGNDASGNDNLINPPIGSEHKSDGTLAMKKRFPLSRLSMVATPIPPVGPSADAGDILKYFGLTWDPANNLWVYDHGNPGSILRLSQIPADRDPDFFEVLKAALAVGGLGKQFGFNFPATYAVTLPSSRIGGDDGRIEDQVVQIAANIIDQADPDGYPTRIQFNGRVFYGVEDIPRLYRAHETGFNVGQMGAIGSTAGFGPRVTDAAPIFVNTFLYVSMVYPELWNPHRPSPNAEGATPTNFRIVAKTFTPVGGEALYFWGSNMEIIARPGLDPADALYFSDFSSRPNGPNCSGLITYTSGEGAGSGNANAALTFNTGTGEANFREPRPLSAVGYPAGSNATGTPNNPDMTVNSPASPTTPDTMVAIAESAVPPPLHGGNNTTYRTALGFVASYLPIANTGVFAHWLNLARGRGGPISFELQYQDPGTPTRWWTMDKWEIAYSDTVVIAGIQSHVAHRADPRSTRWGSLYTAPSGLGDPDAYGSPPAANYRYDTGITANPTVGNFATSLHYTVSQAPGWTGAAGEGNGAKLGELQANLPSSAFRYTDPDGILRSGDAQYASASSSAGWPMHTGNTNSRPVVLNRPFRSVAELGHVFRDTPWRNLDFMSPVSADRALLDVFTVSDVPEDGIVAGRVNLNTRQAPVLAALIQNAALATGADVTEPQATAAAAKLTQWTSSTDTDKGPLSDRSELVGRFVSGTTFKGPLEEMANELTTSDRPIKASREALAKALADAGTTRSWNFLVDIIAQSGQVTTAGAFLPQGESRTWNSVAIDRFTGEVIEQFNESIQE